MKHTQVTHSHSLGYYTEPVYRPSLNRDQKAVIVSDSTDDGNAIATLFRLEGFDTTVFRMADEAQVALENNVASILVLDFDFTETIDFLSYCRANHMGLALFAISRENTVDHTVETMRAGAFDVFAKPINAERLITSVRNSLRRNVQITPPVNGKRDVVVRGFPFLTPREREVLQLIINGKTNKEAGDLLEISNRTIEVHRARIMDKLGAQNTADLMRIVLTY